MKPQQLKLVVLFVVLTVATVAIASCGGGSKDKSSDESQGAIPKMTVPVDKATPAAPTSAEMASDDEKTSSNSTDGSSTSDSATNGQSTGSTATTTANPNSGGTSAPAAQSSTKTSTQQKPASQNNPNSGGTGVNDGQYKQFCKENPGAC